MITRLFSETILRVEIEFPPNCNPLYNLHLLLAAITPIQPNFSLAASRIINCSPLIPVRTIRSLIFHFVIFNVSSVGFPLEITNADFVSNCHFYLVFGFQGASFVFFIIIHKITRRPVDSKSPAVRCWLFLTNE